MQDMSDENLILKLQGLPKTGPERIQNWFPIASSTRKPSEDLFRASWGPLGGLSDPLESLSARSWTLLSALGAEKEPNINLAIMEREAGEYQEFQALQPQGRAASNAREAR